MENPSSIAPIAVSVSEACRLTGFRPTSLWKFIREGRVQAIRIAGVRRTLVSVDSLRALLALPAAAALPRRRRGRPRKHGDARASREAT
jgi:hypothetical protein